MRFLLLLLFPLLACALSPATASAAPPPFRPGPLAYDFADPAKENAVAITVESPLKPVVGYADGVSGSALFDPAKPEATAGTIRVAVASLRFSNEGYSASARGYGLNQDKYPEIVCDLKKIERIKKTGEGAWDGRVAVDFTMKGTTKRLSIPLSVRHFPGRAQERDGRVRFGDLLVVRSTFTVKRSDFNVAPDVPPAVCGDEVELRVAVVGTHVRDEPKAAPVPKPVPAAVPLADRLDAHLGYVREQMREHHVPSAAVAVVRNFEAAPGGGKVDRSVLYPTGAMGWPVAAVVALRLVSDGRLSLDEDVNARLKTWKVPGGRKVTLRHLLANRSGFTFHKYEGYPAGGAVPTLAQVLAGTPPAQTPPAVPATEPGATYKLAAENYTVLQQLIEDVTGKPWNQLLREEVVAPLGGTAENTFSSCAVLRPGGAGVKAALGHAEDGSPVPGGGRAYPELAASGLWTNADEFPEFLADLLSCAAGRPEGRLLDQKTARLLLTRETDEQMWGFGHYERGGTTYLFRGGNTAGYYCHLDADPERGNAVIVFANRNLCWQFANEVRDALARSEGWPGY
jgi:CubicO group peptidase (beta-lactamase class C family)/polyisoprenoid-binding protein YceI